LPTTVSSDVPPPERDCPRRFEPMRRLLDDDDILAISPPAKTFSRLRRAHRKIYRMYVGQYRVEASAFLRDRLLAIAADEEWGELAGVVRLTAKLGSIWLGFHLAWMGHGLHAFRAERLVTRLLRVYQASLPGEFVTISAT
jgi:hypothetical protein